MTHRTLLFETKSPSDPVAKELAKLYNLEVLDTTKVDQIQGPGWTSRIAGLVLDCSGKKGAKQLAADKAALEAALAGDAPVVLLNVTDGEYMAGLCGIGFETGCAVVSPYGDGSAVIEDLDPAVQTASETDERGGTQDSAGTLQLMTKEQRRATVDVETLPTDYPFAQLEPEERAEAIEKVLEAEERESAYPEIDSYRELVGDSGPGALPPGQVSTRYVVTRQSQTIDGRQTFTNEVTWDVALIASYRDPPYKYLRLTSLGAGFSPASGGDINKDGRYKRRYFQDSINVHMVPSGTDLTTLQFSPTNVNGAIEYTTSSSFTVGVDVSKNPGFNASYTIGQSESSTIRDFDIINKTSGKSGKWDYQLGMSASSHWDLFKEPFMKKGRVKSLPYLAKYNLQPVTTIVWWAPKTFRGTVPVQMNTNVTYYAAWVTGDWAKFTEHLWWTTYYKYKTWYVDFSSVNPEGGS